MACPHFLICLSLLDRDIVTIPIEECALLSISHIKKPLKEGREALSGSQISSSSVETQARRQSSEVPQGFHSTDVSCSLC